MRIIDKLFLLKYTRKLVVWYYSKNKGGVYKSIKLRSLYKKYRGIDADFLSYGWTSDLIDGPVTIGKYTSIGKNVRRFDVNHYTTYATTHPCIFNPLFGWVDKDERLKSHLDIGNDVWIGENVLILPSCHKIGNGAIIAAGSVLTKDVPSYEIWGGGAAHFIKKRFSDDTIKKLEHSQWWNYPEAELKELKDFFCNPDELVRVLESKNQ